MSSAYSQAEYLASLPRQVEIPPTTPEHYITGLYALNLAAPEGTSGDWHDVFHWQGGAEQPRPRPPPDRGGPPHLVMRFR